MQLEQNSANSSNLDTLNHVLIHNWSKMPTVPTTFTFNSGSNPETKQNTVYGKTFER